MMRRFIIKCFIFSLPMVLFGLFVYAQYLERKIEVNESLDQIARHDLLVMGDSQMQRLKPEFLGENTFNFASSGEHYYFTYQKLLYLLKGENPVIKKIVLGISAHNFAPIYSKLFNPQKAEGQKSFKRYLYFIQEFDGTFLNLNQLFSKRMYQNIHLKPDMGGYFESENKCPDASIINRVFKMHYDGGVENNASKSQMKYLSLINQLCLSKNVELILVSLPYHPAYKAKVDKAYFKFLDQSISTLKGVKYISFLNDDINLSWMSDANHLNKVGAQIYTQKLSSFLNSLGK